MSSRGVNCSVFTYIFIPLYDLDMVYAHQIVVDNFVTLEGRVFSKLVSKNTIPGRGAP